MKLVSRIEALDQAVEDAWSRFGGQVGWYKCRAVDRLTRPDALSYIVQRFKWYNRL
jgi:hypothetical protein